MASTNDEKLLTLKTFDKQEFIIPERVAMLSTTIKYMIEDDCATVIPLPNVDSKTLSKVIVYLNKHADESVSDDEKKKFDKEFVSKEPLNIVVDYVLAANYLNIKDLLNIACDEIAERTKDKSVKWVRKTFNIVNDFTPEEEKEVRDENPWAFEGVDADEALLI